MMHGAFRLAVIACLALLPAPILAQQLHGPAMVADGDSLSIAGIRVRLFGIDAPELDQQCHDGERRVACGELAKARLQSLIGNSEVSCTRKATDSYGRIVAVCRIGSSDLGQEMVEAGWATAFRKYSEDYVPAETRARAAKVGLWQWTFQPPEDYRAARERNDEPARDTRRSRPTGTVSARTWESGGQCLIKGNRNRRGEWIYHLPGMPYYEATRAEEYFCTEAAAQAAGYRRAIVR